MTSELLPCGATLVLLPDSNARSVVFEIFVRVGRSDEGTKPGVTALLTRAIGADAATRTPEALAREIGRIGTLSATLADEWIELSAVSAPDAESLGKTVKLLLMDMLLAPRFSEEALATARESLRRERLLEALSPVPNALRTLRLRAFGSAAGGRNPLGTAEGTARLTVRDVERFHATALRPQSTVLVVAGKFEEEAMRPLLTAQLSVGGWDEERKNVKVRPTRPDLPDPIASDLRDLPLPCRHLAHIVALGWLAPGLGNAEGKQLYPAFLLLNTLLAGNKIGRLYPALRDNNPLCYEIRSRFEPGREASLWSVYTFGNSPKDPVKTAILSEVAALDKKPFTEQEVRNAQVLLLAEWQRERQRLKARAYAFGVAEVLGLGSEWETKFPVFIERTRASDVQKAAQMLFAGSPATVFTVR